MYILKASVISFMSKGAASLDLSTAFYLWQLQSSKFQKEDRSSKFPENKVFFLLVQRNIFISR